MPAAFFVYGTLKRGHLRGNVWPRDPISVEQGLIRAALFDLGPYPGIAEGDDWVLGELWLFRVEDMPPVIDALDRAEGYSSLGTNNYYDRRVIEVHLNDGIIAPAYTYFFGSAAQLQVARPITANQTFNGYPCAAWPDASSRVPKSIEEE